MLNLPIFAPLWGRVHADCYYSAVINFPAPRSLAMNGMESELARRKRFEALTRAHRDDLYRYAFWLARDHAVADDAVQESLLRAWKAFDSLEDESRAKPWLMTILRREHARLYEKKRPDMVAMQDLSQRENAMLGSSHNTDIDDLRAAIFGLDDSYREPLVLQVLMGYSTEQIAEHMNLRQNAVLTRLFRARKQLKGVLEGKAGRDRSGGAA